MSHRGYFEGLLTDLRGRIFLMSGRVRDAFSLAYDALVTGKQEYIEAVYALDQEVNQLHMKIGESCFSLISRQQPVARDLRLIITVFNVSVALEHMGNQARGMARAAERMKNSSVAVLPVPHSLDIMKRMAQGMHDDTFAAWEQRDIAKLQAVLDQDGAVDDLDIEVQAELFVRMASTKEAAEIEILYDLLRCSREVEKFADLACDIARDVAIFLQETQSEAIVPAELGTPDR